MRTLLNILWHFPFFWFLQALMAYIIWRIWVILVIPSPIWFWLIELAKFLLAPFSRVMIDSKELYPEKAWLDSFWKKYSLFVRITYFPIGLIFAFFVILDVIFLSITIIGIPLAVIIAKQLGTVFNPVNKICVSLDVYRELQRKKAENYVNNKI